MLSLTGKHFMHFYMFKCTQTHRYIACRSIADCHIRAAFDDEAVKYVGEHYPHGATTVYGKKQGNQYKIIVCISSSKFNPNNYWNGRWRSTWQVTFGAGGGQATLDGKLQVNVHYYEDGNVQLNTTTEKHLQAPAGDASATASTVLKAIIKAEQAFHASLDTSYTTMGDTTFKALRRALPITRQKINWNNIRTYKLGSEMSQKVCYCCIVAVLLILCNHCAM